MRTLIALAIVLISTSVFAQPYIVTDPQTDASIYRIRLSLDNGVTWSEWVEAQAINNAMKFNIGPINKGLYKGEAQSGAVVELTDSQTGVVSTVTSWSTGSFFILNKKQGNAPSTLKLEK